MSIRTAAATSHTDTICCSLYFTGQNLFFLLIYMYLNTYFTDIGIPVLAVAGIALAVKVLDAFCDPVCAGLLERLSRRQKTMPWLRLLSLAVPLSTALLFAIPHGLSPALRIVWACGAFLLWSASFTLCSQPMYGLQDGLTETHRGYTVLNPLGRVCSMAAAMALLVLIPGFRAKLGGWQRTAAVLAAVGAVSMLPVCFRRRTGRPEPNAFQPVTLRMIVQYLRGNRYLCIYYLTFLVIGTLNLSSCWGLYISRHCLHNEALLSVTGLLSMIPGILIGAFLPSIARRTDKFRLYYEAVVASLVMQVIRYLAGYEHLGLYLLTATLAAIPTGLSTSILFRYTCDCMEYGRYMGQEAAPGLLFSTQILFIKLQAAAVTVFGALVLAIIGFTEGEGAVQAPEFADRLWSTGILIPAAGMLAGLLILRHFDLTDHDVALMSMCNAGQISREDAQRQFTHAYRPA